MSKPTYIAAIDIGTHSTIGAIAEKLPNKTIQIKAIVEVPTRMGAVVQGRIKDVNNTLFDIKSICKKLNNQCGIVPNKLYLHSSWLSKEAGYEEWSKLFEMVNTKHKESMTFISVPNIMALKADMLMTPAEQNNGCLLIDMGAGSTSYLLRVKGEEDQIGIVPSGGWHISNDLTFKGLSFEYAERLKIKLGNAQADKVEFPSKYISLNPNGPFDINKSIRLSDLATMIEERVDDTAKRFLGKLFKEGHLSIAGRKIVLTGGASLLTNIDRWYQEKSRLDVRYGDALTHIDSDELTQKTNRPKYHTLLAMLLYGTEDCRIEKTTSWTKRLFPKEKKINDALDNAIGTLF